jgi:hypothetical protein
MSETEKNKGGSILHALDDLPPCLGHRSNFEAPLDSPVSKSATTHPVRQLRHHPKKEKLDLPMSYHPKPTRAYSTDNLGSFVDIGEF